MENIFFTSWENVARVIIMTFLAYVSLIFLIRISGKRTLSKMNAFDFVVTIALGSAFATISLNDNIAIAEGVTCFAILVFMQYIITWLSVRFRGFKKLISGNPILLLYKGELYEDILKQERIAIDEIYLSARKEGIDNLNDIDAIVLETTGDISIMKKISNKEAEAMKDVKMSDS
ncbi:YetF domain-containing protein [Bernardetia sp. ABR2-2B]|uniref:DUF421 domain-containing protein n=1 Tax=Bernardetia sp. ABR2-2B TaxID=3127472 RepID=UPI0030CEA95C